MERYLFAKDIYYYFDQVHGKSKLRFLAMYANVCYEISSGKKKFFVNGQAKPLWVKNEEEYNLELFKNLGTNAKKFNIFPEHLSEHDFQSLKVNFKSLIEFERQLNEFDNELSSAYKLHHFKFDENNQQVAEK